jgi:hypothetical protein
MEYWPAIDIVTQVCGELGLEIPTDVASTDDKLAIQIRALLNSAGNELITYYPWEQFVRQYPFTTVDGQQAYELPTDWAYFIDQTQWDRTNHWPLMGPKTAQEWAWLKGGLLAAAPRTRFRVMQNEIYLHPVPGATPYDLNMEYICKDWLMHSGTPDDMVTANGDIIQFYPWLIIKFVKLKFYELKGFDTGSVVSEFMRVFNSMTGKSRGAPVLSLAPRFPPMFIGPWNVPDGSWDVTP